ncbi:phosphoenolpyruvate--protein phosphotransferase [uncultured Parasutterella sp.]|uniref:phosphoenolpyruvate--protein phosphotransferase n=1 Tax=uncultured Parasutterella sp. TaxID=1263098 RepID=UPI0025913AF1|nr:phosphoenolpyruvate--protein phosphotransferase [uncultured Parasutterella sp.]
MTDEAVRPRQELRGVGVSSGIGFGQARVMNSGSLQLPQYQIEASQSQQEVARLASAITAVNKELDLMIRRSPKKAPKEVKAFLEVFRMLVNDETLFTETSRLIEQKLINAEWALEQHLEEVRKVFENLSDSYLAERGDDIEHVVTRLQEELTGGRRLGEQVRDAADESVILVTHDLSFADVIWLTEYEELDLVGIVTEKGGPTSHTAVLSQTLFIPAIVGVGGAVGLIQSGDRVFVDSHSGTIICNPDAKETKEIASRVKDQERNYSQRFRARRRAAQTKDGFRMTLKANVAMVSGLDDILHLGAQGIGLFRSEYLFMGRQVLLTEQEQYESYRTLIEGMGKRPVTIRTIDVGGDKILTPEALHQNVSSGAEKEDNPALGLRAIRFSLVNPNLFLIQLRAILRAAHGFDVRILLPLVSNLHEIEEAKRYIALAKAQLSEEQVPFNPDVKVGIMVELPAAVLCIEEFLEASDFICIGTNDLIQYCLGVDRGNAAVAPLYDELHPAVLKLLKMSAKAAAKAEKPISICGEAGGKSRLVPIFIGLGIKELSMAPMNIPEVKEAVLGLKHSACVRLVQQLSKAHDGPHAAEILDQFWEKEENRNV